MIHIRRLVLLFALALIASPITVIPLPDITATGVAQRFSSTVTGQVAIWVEVVCPSGNAATVRLGSTTVAPNASTGVPCAPGGTQFYPVVNVSPGVFARYDLSTLQFLGQAGDKVSITYAQ